MFEGHSDVSQLEKTLMSRLPAKEIRKWIQKYSTPYRELMSYYKCAMMEVCTKFNVLDEELSLRYDRNPIESIKSRLKTPESILDKLQRRGLYPSVENIEENVEAFVYPTCCAIDLTESCVVLRRCFALLIRTSTRYSYGE